MNTEFRPSELAPQQEQPMEYHEVREFESIEQAFEFMKRNTDEANKHLAPEQEAVTWGDHWVRFYDLTNRIVIFGTVMPLDDIEKQERELGAPDSEIRYMRDVYEENHRLGYMSGTCYSILEPDGEWGDTHRHNLWPIDQTLYDAAQAVGWNIDLLDDDGRAALTTVYEAHREHVLAHLGKEGE